MRIIENILKPFPNIIIGDFSVSGYKASDIVTAYSPYIADFHPDIAVILIGTNDMRVTDDEFRCSHNSFEEYKRDMDYITTKLRQSGCKVILCTLPPFELERIRSELAGWNILYTEEIRALYNEGIKETASRHGAVLLDMEAKYTAYTPSELTLSDGVHLNGLGQRLLASKVFGILAPLLV
jgi:lysophospholipase L1-like esterase